MNIFDVIIVQPIFNALLIIYGLLPGHDFGISIIIFTILVRLALWPLIKKQLHQTKLMRSVQPELKKIKARTKGNKQLEAQLMMELYRERGIKPFSSIGILIIQLPIFIALFQVINIITTHREQISRHVYEGIRSLDPVNQLINDPKVAEGFLGFIDLTKSALHGGSIYFPLLILALLAALFQYIQTRQLMPVNSSKKKLRDILKESANGKDVDQSEMTAIMSNRMALFMPILLLVFALYLPGAVILYYAVSSLVAIIQQHFVLSKDEEEMMSIVEEKEPKKTHLKKRIIKPQTAKTTSSKKAKKRR